MGPGVNGIVNITVATESCSQCVGSGKLFINKKFKTNIFTIYISGNPLGYVEGGVRVHLIGEYDAQCMSLGLDNLEMVDYDNGLNAFFDGTPDGDGDDDGMGACKGVSITNLRGYAQYFHINR